jgi:hypothetical protein
MAGESMPYIAKRRLSQKSDRASRGETETVIIASNKGKGKGKGLPLRSLPSETPTPDRDMLPFSEDDLTTNCLHNRCHLLTALTVEDTRRTGIGLSFVHRFAYQSLNL